MRCSFDLRIKSDVHRAAATFCILLIFLTGIITAVHFHADQSAASDHLCSVCALAHAGVVPVELGPQVPIFRPLSHFPANRHNARFSSASLFAFYSSSAGSLSLLSWTHL
jgi:hypothetical protein